MTEYAFGLVTTIVRLASLCIEDRDRDLDGRVALLEALTAQTQALRAWVGLELGELDARRRTAELLEPLERSLAELARDVESALRRRSLREQPGA
jgi:hypothetical protein